MPSGRSAAYASHAALFVTGVGGIVAQTLMLRELLVTFHGSELAIGIVLACWLLLEASGAALARLLRSRWDGTALFALATLCFCLLLPLDLLLAREARSLFGLGPGQAAGVLQLLAISATLMLPVALPHGLAFTVGAGMSRGGGAGRAYTVEALGSAAGGALLTYLLLPRLGALAIAAIVVPPSLLAAAALLASRRASRARVAAPLLLAACALLSVAASLAPGAISALELASLRRQWQGFEILERRDSPYAALLVTRRGEQIDVFVDGRATATLPVPDLASTELIAHLPLAHHPSPRRILLLGGGAGGVLAEILKHPVEHVDYVEQDAVLLELLEAHEPPESRSAWRDARLQVTIDDGRRFLARTGERYDVIIVGSQDAGDLATNRFFTLELFQLSRSRLEPGGLLAASAPGSLTYLGPALRDANACLLATLRAAFEFVRVIPGETNLYLASDAAELERVDPPLVVERLAGLGVLTLPEGEVSYRLDEERGRSLVRSLEARLQGGRDLVNRDTRPIEVFFALGFQSAALSPGFQRILARLASLTLLPLLLAAALPLLLLLPARRSRLPVLSSVCVTGFAGMLVEMVVVFLFESRLGTLYQGVGAIVAAFMAGTSAGAALSARLLEPLERRSARRLLVGLDLALAACCGLLALLATRLADSAAALGAPLAELGLLGASLAGGALVGAPFPVAVALQRRGSRLLEASVGAVSAADLLGGALGGVAGGVLLLPVLGLAQSCVLLVVWKAATALSVALARTDQGGHP